MDVDIVDESISKKLKHNEEVMAKTLGNSTSIAGSTSGSFNTDNLNGSNSDMSYNCDDNDGDEAEDCDVISDYDDNDDYMFDVDDNYDDYVKMQAQFDNVDLPPGVEAPVSWLEDPAPIENLPAVMNTSIQTVTIGVPAGAVTYAPSFPDLANDKNKSLATSSSTVPEESISDRKKEEEKEDHVLRKYELFKRFDTVDDFSDHHYNLMGFSGQQPPRAWIKKIQDDWRILENDLPDGIYVRVYETRMDLLRAVIVGPAGTPYHDGLFVFDVLFPPTYPDIPPMVYYYSGGLRLNPNLYDCGKVCLSLLNTWNGNGNEKWMPNTSTMLQVLVSIQALILNVNPFFNEPGYESTYVGLEGERRSKAYNENVFILSLKTMMYTLRRAPKHFEDLVDGHFRSHAHDVLSACKVYMEGAPVGSVVKGNIQDGTKVDSNGSKEFKAAVAKMMKGLVSNFIKNGSKDCEQFLAG